MANDYYQLYNHAYSFASSEVNSGGVTYSLPQNDYGIYGQHVDAFFNTITRNAGATGNLAVWFVSDKGLTYYTHSLGATAAITGYVQSRFPITPSSEGLGLIDLRGSPDWVKIVGDGIVGPTRGSTASVAATDSTQYVNGIKAVFGLLKNQYPNIDWAIAGLPHIPYVMAYAPPVGESPTWDPSLTNTGGYTAPAWWDPEHPTGSSGSDYYNWLNAPQELRSFYEQLVTDGIQEMVFDNCDIGWVCPDIRVPYADSLPFYEFGYDSEANYLRNKKLCELASAKAKTSLVKSYPFISTMYPSRTLNQYDDPESVYGVAESVAGNYIDIDGSSYSGTTANAAEGYYPSVTYRYDMIQAAIDGTAHGFIFYDPIPSLIEIACTADISSGQTGYDAQIRSRNYISTVMYGGAYVDGYAPSGSGFADPCVKAELQRYAAKRTIGYLDDVRESVNLASHGSGDQGYGNGWLRGIKNPSASPISYDITESTNREQSDLIYGEQYWTQRAGGGGNCDCPVDCESGENPYATKAGSLGCCCIEVYEYPPQPGDSCDCPNIDISLTSRNTPACSEYAECPCTTTHTVDLGALLSSQNCSAGTCKRSVQINGSCNCMNAIIKPGGLSTCPPNQQCLSCQCLLVETPELVVSCNPAVPTTNPEGPIGGGGGGGPISSGSLVEYSLILDMQSYKKSSSDSLRFIAARASGERYANWKNIYEALLIDGKYATFVQAGETILKPSVSTPALRTHSNKEVLRHLPNQYFTT
jgi:hypothetical protein